MIGKAWIKKLLAVLLALTMAWTCLAMAEEESIVADAVDEMVADAGEVALELPREESAEQPAEAQNDIVTEAAEAAGVAPTGVAIDLSQGNTFYLGMPVQLTAILEPADAQTALKWKSSKKKVAKVSADGLLTPLRAGKTKITVTTGNKLKAAARVTVKRNMIDNITRRPTGADIGALGAGWGVWLKSVERTAAGKYVCGFYLLNGLGKCRQINNFGVQLYVGGNLVAQKTVKKIKVACGKGKSKVFKVTFNAADLVAADPLLLPQYGADDFNYVFTQEPSLSCNNTTTKITPTAQPIPQNLPAGVENNQENANYMLELINQERASLGLAPYTMDAELTRAACVRAGEISEKFSHTRPDGTSCSTVSIKAPKENISSARMSGRNLTLNDTKKVFNNYRSSENHWSKIVSDQFSTVGICVYAIEDSETYSVSVYWALEFAKW